MGSGVMESFVHENHPNRSVNRNMFCTWDAEGLRAPFLDSRERANTNSHDENGDYATVRGD